MSCVLVYRNELLPLSETFILSQAKALRRYTPVFSGIQSTHSSLNLSGFPATQLTHTEHVLDKVKRRLFLRFGIAGGFVASLRQHSPKLMHAHFAVDAAAALALQKRLRIPLIVTLHGYDVSCDEKAFMQWPSTRAYLREKRTLWKRAAQFLCVSEHIREQAIERGFPEEKLLIHKTGIDLSLFRPVPLSKKESLVLFVGRLVEKKGCRYLLSAFERVRQHIPAAKLVVIGDGPLRAAVEEQARPLGESCHFTGYQSQEEIRLWMQRARALVAPSIRAGNGDTEGLPTVLCEAHAAGIPSIAFKAKGVVEAFPPECRTVLPREQDTEGLAMAIMQLLKDDDEWQRLSDVGRRYVESNFDLARQTQMLEDLYDDVIVRQNGR